MIGDCSPAMLLVAASRTARRTAVSGSCYTPVHRTAILSTLATAFCAAALLTGCGGSKHASPQTSTSKHTYTSVLVGDHGFRYRVTVKLRLPAIIPRLSGPPGAQYVIGDPAAFDLTIENLTRGRRAPVFPRAVAPGAGVVSAWWALPKPLRARAGALTGNKFSGRYADLAAVITRDANDFDPHDPVDVDAGQTLTLGGEQPHKFEGGYFLPGGVGTWLVPTRDVAAWRSVTSRAPAYVTLAASLSTFLDHRAVTTSPCAQLLLVWSGRGQAISIRSASGARTRNCAHFGILNPFR